METKEYTFADRAEWPPGPWCDEPDKVQWQDLDTGLPCLAVRHMESGHWCGYVGVAEGHPLFGKSPSSTENNGVDDLRAHGGVNFGAFCRPQEGERGVCHVAAPGEPDRVWWLGFDCAHAWDYSPLLRQLVDKTMGRTRLMDDQVYRDLPYVKAECADLARQLKEVAHGNT